MKKLLWLLVACLCIGAQAKDLAFVVSDKSGDYNIWKGEYSGTNVTLETQLTFHESPWRVSNLKIDHVHEWLVYSYVQSGDRMHYFRIIDFDGNLVRDLVNMPSGGGASDVFDLSPDCNEIVFSKGVNDQGLTVQEGYLLGVDDTNLRLIMPANAVRGTNTHKTGYDWLADGRIVFSCTKVWSDEAGQQDVYVYDDGIYSAWSQNTSSGEANPLISEDGTRIAVRTRALYTPSGIDVADWSNGTRQQLFPQGTSYQYYPRQWLDNSTLLYAYNKELFVVNDDGSGNVNLSTGVVANISTAQILQNYEPGLMAYYPMVSDAADATAHGYDGTVYGAQHTTNGYGGGAYTFDGENDYIDTIPADDIPEAISMAMWIYPIGGTGGRSYLFGSIQNSSGGKDGFICSYFQNTERVSFNYYKGNTTHGGVGLPKGSVPLNRWSHVVLCSDSNRVVTAYVNGRLVAEGAFSTALDVHDKELMLGRSIEQHYTTNSPSFNGTMDDVRIYNRGLAPGEVETLYGESVLSTVSNLGAAQRPGTKLVDIQFDVACEAQNTTDVLVQLLDQGTNMAASSFSGDVGVIATGENNAVAWDAGTDWPGSNATLAVRVVDSFGAEALVDVAVDSRNYMLNVSSANGTPIPAVGSHAYAWKSTVTCSVDAAVDAGWTYHANSGWTGTGSVPGSGNTNTTGEIVLDDVVSSIAWNWDTSHWVDTEVAGIGTIEPGDGWYAHGVALPVTASETNPDWLFSHWCGDLTGDYTQSNTTVVVDAPMSITANFSDDVDGDGLDNFWEWYFQTDPRNWDSDGDQFDDYAEVINHGDPNSDDSWRYEYVRDNGSIFGLYASNSVLNVGIGELLLDCKGGNVNLGLQLEQSEDLATWSNAAERVEWSIPVDGEKRFFRVKAVE